MNQATVEHIPFR